VANNSADPHRAAVPASIEGTYLAGQGVVFSMTLPAQARADLATTPPASESKRASEWDQIRGQLHGERQQAADAPKHDTLTDALLHLLASNGKNFTHLPENENITIAVTFRNESAGNFSYWLSSDGSVRSFLNDGTSNTRLLGMSSGSSTIGSSTGSGSSTSSGGTTMGLGTSSSSSNEAMTPERELELLGDLHLKRNNLAEAATSYERAIAKLREMSLKPNVPMEHAQAALDKTNARLRDLSGKLAEVYIKLGKLDAAKKALSENPISMTVDNNASTPKAPPAMRLSGKLILTAAKRDLDRVGNGQIPFSEFQKLASIQILNFDMPRK
jgi:hypothetical protein